MNLDVSPIEAEDDSAVLCPYQHPGGHWAVLPDMGMTMDSSQRMLLDANPEHTGTDDATSVLEQGLLFEGSCPRCAHEMCDEFSFGLLVDDASVGANGLKVTCSSTGPNVDAKRLIRRVLRRKAHTSDKNATLIERLTFVCSCGRNHANRPSDSGFAGCGAVWSQPTIWPTAAAKHDSPSDTDIRVGTAEDALRAVAARKLSVNSLERIRLVANQWRAGATGITAALVVATLLKGSKDGTALGRWAVPVATISAMLLLAGAWFSLSASSGVGGYDHYLLAPDSLRRYERTRGRTTISQVKWSVFLTILGLLCVVLAATLPTKSSPTPKSLESPAAQVRQAS